MIKKIAITLVLVTVILVLQFSHTNERENHMEGYRSWLSGQANTGNRDAQLGLEFQGNDGKFNDSGWTFDSVGGGGGQAYSPEELRGVLNSMYSGYKSSLTRSTNPSNSYQAPAASAAAPSNAADLAYLDDQQARLQRQQGSADQALNNGLTSLNDSYNKEVSGANQQRSRALEDFQLKREDTTRAKDSALNRVDSNSRTLADSLRRKIGMASGSSSSAYQQTAPGAVSRLASDERGGVQENYGVNFRNLGQAEDRSKTDFESLLQDLMSQKGQRESDFRSGILDRKNQIDTSLSEVARQRALAKGGGYNQVKTAMAPYAGAIDSRQSEIDNLFNRFRTPFNVKPVNVQTPQLRDYTVDRQTIAQNPAGQSQDPYADALRKKQLEENNPLYA